MDIRTAQMALLDFDGKELREREVYLSGRDGKIEVYANFDNSGTAKIYQSSNNPEGHLITHRVTNAVIIISGTSLLITGVRQNPESKQIEKVRWYLS